MMISHRRLFGSRRRILIALCCVVALWLEGGLTVQAGPNADGVSPNVISRPSGPGSLEGLGASFQPALNTGSAQHTIPLTLPTGTAGFTPSLTLRYDSGMGFGVAGFGWTFGPACIRRQVEEGLPRYGASPDGESIVDRFIGLEGEELVPLQNGYYLAKLEKLFIRYRFVVDHWEAHTKGGTKLEFGLTSAGRVTNLDGTKTFAWCLQRQTDTHGNVIEYSYDQPSADDRQIYLSEIRYGPGAPPWTDSYGARMTYENRPDPFTDYRPGFLVRTAKRLTQVDTLFNEQLIRRYTLGYEADTHWSFLTTFTTYGADGISSLPATVLGYSLFDSGNGIAPISAAGRVLPSQGEPPEALDAPDAGLIDLNADGLPDLLATGTGHVAYLNRGVQETGTGMAIVWEGPVTLSSDEQRAQSFQLSSGRVHLADMTGDGLADLVVTDSSDNVEYFTNTGQLGWTVGCQMASGNSPPPAPNGSSSQSVKTSDLSFNKRIDIIQSQSGALFSWFNQGNGVYTGPMITDAPLNGSQFVDFADAGVFLADMNGDRLVDIAKITTSSVIWWANMGYSRFGPRVEIALPDRSLDDSPGGNLQRARLLDISGDGLSDLVVEQATGSDLWFWQNLGNGEFSASRVVIDLPVTPSATAHWADLNGNGTTDLIYSDATLPGSRIQVVDLGNLIGGSPHYNLLVSIDYAYGRKTQITYRTTTEFLTDAYVAGHPWLTAAPFPSHVVSDVRTSIGLDLDGYADEGPDGDVYQTKFVYRDGYYDPIEHQFRGFAFVKQIDLGDERFGGSDAPTLITRHAFHTGAPDGVDNDGDGEIDESGDLWTGREEEPLKGTHLWMETTAAPDDPNADGAFAADAVVFERMISLWEVRTLCRADGGLLVDLLGDVGYQTADPYGREVRQIVQVQSDQHIIERGSGASIIIRTLSDVDALGNPTFAWAMGDLSNANDDLYTGFEFARNEPAWLVDRMSRTFQLEGGPGGSFISESRNYYDGMEFVGLPLGQVAARGVLHRTESLVSGGPVPPLPQRTLAIGDPRFPNGRVDVLRQRLDAFGNVIVLRDANGNDRLIGFDPLLRKYATSETIVVGNGQDDLVTQATYDPRLGRMLTRTDMNGHLSRFSYDTFGRLIAEFLPGDPSGSPTKTYTYNLGSPISTIVTQGHDNVAGSPDQSATVFFDGLGRKLGSYEAGGDVTSEVTLFNTRGNPRTVFQPFLGGGGLWVVPPGTVASTTQTHDAAGRVTETITPPDDHAVSARITSEYLPLVVKQYDGEDNNVAGPHENTPRTLVRDGLGRLVEVQDIETISQADPGLFITKYRYTGADLLAEVEDANGNIKYMRYDGLGRRIFLNDIDRGHVTYTVDAVGNLISRVDALNQETLYTYDGANRRLTKDYIDGGHPLGMNRAPDVSYHYDLPHPDYPLLGNAKGRLGWVDDLSGSEMRAYNVLGAIETIVKRIDQPNGFATDYKTTSLTNRLGQKHQMTYPDGQVVHFTYNARGLVESVPGYVDLQTHTPSGQKATHVLSNGVTSTHTYDQRLRMNHLVTQSVSTVFQDLMYSYDLVANVVSITDGGAIPLSDPRNQSAAFVFDNQYRLSEAVGSGFGTIDYDFDRLDNMVIKSSPNIPDENVNLGAMTSGGLGGTVGRIGRAQGDPPGPHALTLANNGVRTRILAYDDNGNMTAQDGDTYVYDFADRLGRVIKDGKDVRYFYDFKGRRIIKRVDGVQTSYIGSGSEIRDGRLIKYIAAGGSRVARVEGSGPTPVSTTQTFDLQSGWNLISFQVDPGVTDPSVLLASVSGSYAAIYGYGGVTYTKFVPGDLTNTLLQMLPNRGYWIDMTQPAQLTLEGPVDAMAVDVQANTPALVGLPGMALQNIEDLLAQYPTIVSVWGYEVGARDWTLHEVAGPSYLNSLQGTRPGLGYWIVSSANITLTLPPAGATYFYHADHLGSTNVITDQDGSLVSETYNYPFGAKRHEHDTGQNFDPYYQYTGKELDAESGLQYFGARYYDPVLSRFITADPLFAEDHAEQRASLVVPRTANVYAMALNNPVELIDPSGLAAKHALSTFDSASKFAFDVKSTVFVLFDKSSDLHNWLNGGGASEPAAVREVKSFFQKQIAEHAPGASDIVESLLAVDPAFLLSPEGPKLSLSNLKESGLIRLGVTIASKIGEAISGGCESGGGFECFLGKDVGGVLNAASKLLGSSGGLKSAAGGLLNKAINGFGLPSSVGGDKSGKLILQGVQSFLGADGLKSTIQNGLSKAFSKAAGSQGKSPSGIDPSNLNDAASKAVDSILSALDD